MKSLTELRSSPQFSILYVRSLHNGEESISCLVLKTWEIVPKEMEELASPNASESSIKIEKPSNCLCRFCGKCVRNARF